MPTDSFTPCCRVILVCGLPGAGKSTWIANNFSLDETIIVRPDDYLTDALGNYVWTPERANKAWALCYRRVGGFLTGRVYAPTLVFDAQLLTPLDRNALLGICGGAGLAVEAVYVDTPLEVCIQRNLVREAGRGLPATVLTRAAQRAVLPTEKEGFDRVTVVSGLS